ncbi:hypothetical protein PGTUg99_020290 [Puccinia graminis f. sp. tritici]|uniref:Uncharacterized protein n=1 Tax=Puccinia graminis f. sp. tritici TaxID=56615 RepID=A0A5B0LU66_PUCGR|nr:hypothetical protein PGTUg99_020290 [Puccinia graminis f. sp. tritici]
MARSVSSVGFRHPNRLYSPYYIAQSDPMSGPDSSDLFNFPHADAIVLQSASPKPLYSSDLVLPS